MTSLGTDRLKSGRASRRGVLRRWRMKLLYLVYVGWVPALAAAIILLAVFLPKPGGQ